MEEKIKELFNYDEEEEDILKPPYWWVDYTDNCGDRHLATIKDETYLKNLQNNYVINTIKRIEDEIDFS